MSLLTININLTNISNCFALITIRQSYLSFPFTAKYSKSNDPILMFCCYWRPDWVIWSCFDVDTAPSHSWFNHIWKPPVGSWKICVTESNWGKQCMVALMWGESLCLCLSICLPLSPSLSPLTTCSLSLSINPWINYFRKQRTIKENLWWSIKITQFSFPNNNNNNNNFKKLPQRLFKSLQSKPAHDHTHTNTELNTLEPSWLQTLKIFRYFPYGSHPIYW